MKPIFHPEASQEMLESARFYEEKSEELGSDFLAAIEQTTQRILQFPEAGRIERANIRKRLVPGFPFTILYELRNDRIFVPPLCTRPGDQVTGERGWANEYTQRGVILRTQVTGPE